MKQRERFLQLGDFKTIRVEGTTSAIINTQFWERYSTAQVPVGYVPVYGRFYIPQHGYKLDDQGRGWVDVRSAFASEPFAFVLMFD